MDAYLQIRINNDIKKRFIETAKKQGADSSSLVRSWIVEYVQEHERMGDMSKDEVIDKLYDAGYELKEKLGGFKVAKRHAWELNNLLNADLNQFIEKVMTLCVSNDLPMPQELLDVRHDVSLGQAFVMGMIGQER